MSVINDNDIRPNYLMSKYLKHLEHDINTLFTNDKKRKFWEEICPACGNKNMGSQIWYFVRFGFTHIRCVKCETIYVLNRPDVSSLDAFYKESGAVKFWYDEFYPNVKKSRRENIYVPRARTVKSLIEDGYLKTSIADIGSGDLSFLDEVKPYFSNSYGIDPYREGPTIITKRAEDLVSSDLKVDIVTCFEVLEHVYNPVKFLLGIRNILKPGGVLYMTCVSPGLDILVLKEKSDVVLPPLHLNFISKHGMEILLDRCGFHVKKLETPGRLDVERILRSDEYIPFYLKKLLKIPKFQSYISEKGLSSHLSVVGKII